MRGNDTGGSSNTVAYTYASCELDKANIVGVVHVVRRAIIPCLGRAGVLAKDADYSAACSDLRRRVGYEVAKATKNRDDGQQY